MYDPKCLLQCIIYIKWMLGPNPSDSKWHDLLFSSCSLLYLSLGQPQEHIKSLCFIKQGHSALKVSQHGPILSQL